MLSKEISSECADEINSLVSMKVDKQLWMIANYESVPTVIGNAALVQKKIQEMYIFAIDVGLCKRINKDIEWEKEGKKQLNDILNKICNRRSAWDHNSSRENGTENYKEFYSKWVRDVLSKEEPKSEKDWEELYDNLCIEEKSFLNLIEKMINQISLNGSEDDLKSWKMIIKDWYCSSSGRQAIIGQWKKIYIAENPRDKRPEGYNDLNFFVKKCVYKDLEEAEKIILQNGELTNEANEFLKKEREKIFENIRKELIDKVGKSAENYRENKLYAEWYINRIQEFIKYFCENLIPKEVASLLPQDLVQYLCIKNNKEVKCYYQSIQIAPKLCNKKIINNSEVPFLQEGTKVLFFPQEFKTKVVRGTVNGVMASLNKKSLTPEQKNVIANSIRVNSSIEAKIKGINNQGSGYILWIK